MMTRTRFCAPDGLTRPGRRERLAIAPRPLHHLSRRHPWMEGPVGSQAVEQSKVGSSEAGVAVLYERTFEFGSTRWTVLLVTVLLLPVGLVPMSYGLYRAQVAQQLGT